MSTQTSNSGETTPGHSIPNPVKVTTQTVVEMKQKGEKISMLTAYDFTMARIIDAAGIDVLLVGDSASNVMAGNETTVPITLDHMIYHTQCVVRGVDRALVIADMPFMSYATDDMGFENATRLMQAGANSIKIEGGEWISKMASMLADRGIPVCAHMGLTPQAINRIGGNFVQGRDPSKHD